jgi:hypothetical protein
MIHFRPVRPDPRTAIERIAQRRKVEINEALREAVEEDRKLKHERALLEAFGGRRENEPWYIGE